ncbi:MAG: hypothetical protein K0S71_1568 [Clostridia bacterium]|jgi:hypothetical protein|nr:hypothetical protein [Clostridia bacterium]
MYNPSKKEQYEELTEQARKRKIIRNQIILAFFGMFGLALTVLFFKYGPQKVLNMTLPHEKVTYYEVPGISNESTETLVQKVLAHTQRSNKVNTIYNEAIKQYDKKGFIDKEYISAMENLEEFDSDISIPDLDALSKEIMSKKIQMLSELNNTNKDVHYINRMIEEIKSLNSTYRESIIYILQEANIKCKCTPKGIKIYE